MNPRTRTLLFAAAGLFLAFEVGSAVADESYALGGMIGVTAMLLLFMRGSPARPEAWILGAVICGYLAGSRGFAQVQLAQRFPLFPAEGVLLVAFPCWVARIAFKRERGVRTDGLAYVILAWMILGIVRIPFDVSRFGFMALRDFAMVYYATFYFIGLSLGYHEPSRRVLTGWITFSYAVLVPIAVVVALVPGFFVDHLTVRGVPLVYHKGDLLGTSLACGFYWLWTRIEKTGNRGWAVGAVASLVLIASVPSPRAAMTGLVAANILWLLMGRWRIVAAQAAAVGAGALIVLGAASVSGKRFETTAAYSVYEHAVSIFDLSGQRTYVNAESGDPGGNNQFRLVWWRDVADETLSTSPLFGLGFGADLASRFLQEFEPLGDDSFAARSPHSIVLSVLGRMGVTGTLVWIVVSGYLWRLVWRLFRHGDPDARGLACIIAATWMSACFGVVLEGPMGAVLFWTSAGLGSGLVRRGDAESSPQSPVASEAA